MILPPMFSELRNLYWWLRLVRGWDLAAQRRYYRKIEGEKKRLLCAGVQEEEIRLVCRYLSNPLNMRALERLQAYRRGQKASSFVEPTSIADLT